MDVTDHLIRPGEDDQGEPSSCEVSEREVGYTTRVLLQTLFPYRRQESDKVVRQAGPLQITAYSPNGLPYGKYPRLIAVYLITEAVKRKHLPEDVARRIPLGASMRAFLSELGITARPTGGKAGTIGIVREQLRRLATTTITVERIFDPGSDRASLRNLGLIDSMDFWVAPDPRQLALSEPFLELTAPFYREVVENPVPINLAILRALRKPRAMDLYLWATARKFSLRQPLTLDWDQLQGQFGPETPRTPRGRADFRKDFREAVEQVVTRWPGAGLDVGPEGLTLRTGQPSIPRQARRTA